MATSLVVIRGPSSFGTSNVGEGTFTGRMTQTTAATYLKKIIRDGSRVTNLGQALNQAFDGGGKSNGSLKFNGKATQHASAGKTGVSSVTLFYYEESNVIYLFAMGEHSGSSSYKLCDFGCSSGTFTYGKSVSLG